MQSRVNPLWRLFSPVAGRWALYRGSTAGWGARGAWRRPAASQVPLWRPMSSGAGIRGAIALERLKRAPMARKGIASTLTQSAPLTGEGKGGANKLPTVVGGLSSIAIAGAIVRVSHRSTGLRGVLALVARHFTCAAIAGVICERAALAARREVIA